MAQFVMELPTELMQNIEFLTQNSKNIFGEATRAGAKVAEKYIRQNTDKAFSGAVAQQMKAGLKLTKTYDTSDGGINTKVAFYGYIGSKPTKIKGNTYKGVPRPLLAALREYGASSSGNMPESLKRYWKKKRFIAPAFNRKDEIREAMLAKQRELSKGIIDD